MIDQFSPESNQKIGVNAMNMTRRDMLKLAGVTAAATAVSGCATNSQAAPKADHSNAPKHQIVIIGGGFGGLTVAKELMKHDKNFDVLVLEKNDTFMACPFSNTYLGKLEDVNLGTFVHDYEQAVERNGYKMLQCEVQDINRKNKVIMTSKGAVRYDILVLSPGIDYNYEGQFPKWSKEKINHVRRTAPAALIPGREHVVLERNLRDMEDGDVIITVPNGKYRCPPAPFERACMIAEFMKKEEIEGKVIILNETNKIAKGAAFKEAWKDLYSDIIEYHPHCKISDVDPSKKEISYSQTVYKNDDDIDGTQHSHTRKYEVLNLIVHNKANPVVTMSGVETTKDSFGKVKMAGASFATKTDANIYAVGDVVGHSIPPSGQTAFWSGKQCAKEIAHRLHGKSYDITKILPFKTGNVCYSMVGDNPEEAIMVTHDFSWTGSVIKGKGHVPKDPKTGKFRSKNIAKATRDWYRGIMGDLFS